MSHSQVSSLLLGALVSDAACLGLHWLYDADRIAKIAEANGGRVAFTPVDPVHFDGVAGYFAHAARSNGMLTQYGEVLWLAMRSLISTGGFDVQAYSEAFVAHFGPGGSYQGYIDRPTRGALENIAAELAPSGIDDDQNPAVATLPAIFARYHGTSELAAQRVAAMQVTNVNDVAEAYSAAFAHLMGLVLDGTQLQEALSETVAAAPETIRSELSDALKTDQEDSVIYAGQVGRACHLPTAGPVAFHVLKHSDTYTEAVERNISAGGDSAGRSLVIGAVMGAVHGIATPTGVPLEWVLKMKDGPAIWQDCLALGHI